MVGWLTVSCRRDVESVDREFAAWHSAGLQWDAACMHDRSKIEQIFLLHPAFISLLVCGSPVRASSCLRRTCLAAGRPEHLTHRRSTVHQDLHLH